MQNTTSVETSAFSDGIDLSRLFSRSGTHRFKNFINNKADDLFNSFNAQLTPLLSYRTKGIDSIDKGTVYLEKGIALKSAKLSKVMKNCKDALCFIATIGDGVEQEVARLTDEERLVDAYILESMGSMAVESMVESFCKDMETKYNAKGKGITLRFSPGYCDWSVAEQKKLFRMIDATRINVSLTDSCLMRPRKSVSGVFGIYDYDGDCLAPSYNPCSDCNKKDCTARRVY
ncbi:MAG: hypothetical protein JXB42_07140 [Deltaproteobacteria bacterium]|nr:hypothetical protein [Deltaproteobacteria bacterium]